MHSTSARGTFPCLTRSAPKASSCVLQNFGLRYCARNSTPPSHMTSFGRRDRGAMVGVLLSPPVINTEERKRPNRTRSAAGSTIGSGICKHNCVPLRFGIAYDSLSCPFALACACDLTCRCGPRHHVGFARRLQCSRPASYSPQRAPCPVRLLAGSVRFLCGK